MAFATADAAVIERWGKDVEFVPAAGGGPYTVSMVQSTQSPDPGRQPPAALVIFGAMEFSGFIDVEAPFPVEGDHFTVQATRYRVFRVAESDSAGDEDQNGFYVYLDNEEED